MSILDQNLFSIWTTQTTMRSITEEKHLSLSAMAIILINQCAVNLTSSILNLPRNFPMRALFVSSCIGWTVYWKAHFQSQEPIQPPWQTLSDLHRTFLRILRLVALVRHVHLYPSQAVVEREGKWACVSPLDDCTAEPREERETSVQRAIDSLVLILASGRVSTDEDPIVLDYVIPR
jgi:hypothetical protein